MERFGPKENFMSGEKNETLLHDFGYSMFGLGYGWRHVIMYAARKQTIIVDFFYIALITSIMFLSLSIAII